jgi:hypothetical protein
MNTSNPTITLVTILAIFSSTIQVNAGCKEDCKSALSQCQDNAANVYNTCSDNARSDYPSCLGLALLGGIILKSPAAALLAVTACEVTKDNAIIACSNNYSTALDNCLSDYDHCVKKCVKG